MALFSTTFADPDIPRDFAESRAASASPTFLLLSSMLDFGMAYVTVGFVLSIARGDVLTGAVRREKKSMLKLKLMVSSFSSSASFSPSSAPS